MNQGNKQNKEIKKLKKNQIIIFGAIVFAITAALLFVLVKIKKNEEKGFSTQEQFSGSTQISEQLQAECQRSVEKLNDTTDILELANEFMKNAQNCKEVYFYVESGKYRPEGMYPDLVTDIASEIAKKNKEKALEILKFSLGIGDWEYYMGPITCNSKSVIEAYIEALVNEEEHICFDEKNGKAQLLNELNNKNFSILAKSLRQDSVVSAGTIEAGLGCPDKISNIIRFIQKSTEGSLSIQTEEEGSESKTINFIFKTANEDKLVLEFSSENSCLQLRNVLVPSVNGQ